MEQKRARRSQQTFLAPLYQTPSSRIALLVIARARDSTAWPPHVPSSLKGVSEKLRFRDGQCERRKKGSFLNFSAVLWIGFNLNMCWTSFIHQVRSRCLRHTKVQYLCWHTWIKYQKIALFFLMRAQKKKPHTLTCKIHLQKGWRGQNRPRTPSPPTFLWDV